MELCALLKMGNRKHKLELAVSDLAHHPQMDGSGVRRPVPFEYFTRERAACAEGITEKIIPADQDPGAKWAGVVHYIDLSLAEEFSELRPIYRAWLSRLGELTKEGRALPGFFHPGKRRTRQ